MFYHKKRIFLGLLGFFMSIVLRIGRYFLLGVLVLCLGYTSAAFATSKLTASTLLKPNENSAESAYKDSFGRDTPRRAWQGLMSAYSAEDPELALHYLDSRYLNQKNVDDKQVLHNLKTALDVGGRMYTELQMSDLPEGDLHDLLPSDVDKIGSIGIDDKTLDVLMVRRHDRQGNAYWQLSQDTLKNLPKIDEQAPKFVDYFAIELLKQHKFFGHSVADMLALLFLVMVSIAVSYGGVWALFYILSWLYLKIQKTPMPITPRIILPLSLLLVALFLAEIMLQAGVPVTLRTPVARVKEGVAWWAMTWLLLRVLDAVFGRAQELSIKKNRPEQVSILGLLRKLAKVILVLFALIIIFGNLGFDLTTGIAALGIGGLALAFGAQKTIENLIGSVVVVADRPIHIGDYGKFGTYEGTVIDIGIRSTRIRTLNRTVVTIPNGEFSALQIENYAKRDMFHFLHNLYIKRDTAPDVLTTLLQSLTQFLNHHPDVNDTWTQVRIAELRQDCFVVEVRCYIIAPDVVVFYDKQSALIVELLKQIQSLGVAHALPSYAVSLQDSTVSQNHNQQP